MKIGQVVGRMTMNHHLDAYRGGRFFLVIPCDKDFLVSAPADAIPLGHSCVVFDELGADIGDRIAFSEGGEACMAFSSDTPVDAYNCMILDTLNYTPPGAGDNA